MAVEWGLGLWSFCLCYRSLLIKADYANVVSDLEYRAIQHKL